MSTEPVNSGSEQKHIPMTRLEIYDQLRRMHRLLKDIPDREDEWEKNALETVAGVLYLAESQFTRNQIGGITIEIPGRGPFLLDGQGQKPTHANGPGGKGTRNP